MRRSCNTKEVSTIGRPLPTPQLILPHQISRIASRNTLALTLTSSESTRIFGHSYNFTLRFFAVFVGDIYGSDVVQGPSMTVDLRAQLLLQLVNHPDIFRGRMVAALATVSI